MALDDLAAAVIGVEANDTEDLQQIHAELIGLRDSEASPPESKDVILEAIGLVERILAGEAGETEGGEAFLGELSERVQHLQRIAADAAASELEELEEVPGEPIDESETPAAGASPAETTAVEDEMDFESDPELLGEFITESQEHIEISESALLALEKNPDDTESINAVFRAFHTIKGTSGFLALNSIQKLAHRAENLLDRGRTGEIRIHGGYADLALESVDMLKAMILELKENLEGPPPPDPESLDDLIDRLENPENRGVSDEDGGESFAPRVGDILVCEDKVSREEVEKISRDGEDEKPIGEKIVQSGAASTMDVAQAIRTQKKLTKKDETVRVSTGRLDGLINMVGELVIINAMIAQNRYILSEEDRTLTRNMGQLGKITRELQDLSISMRMVPLKGTFGKMARLVRDLARKSGKEIQFLTEGEDTEIDRNMVESLNDPLVHMIRNAVDHGVESPEVREAAGKSRQGRLVLRAYHNAGNVVIELQDDGKGLDKAVILKKAVSKGLVDAERELPENEIFKLIFAPGFSTAQKVTDISGRGVGMDVVKKNIESMRGRVEVSSTKGEGSLFSIRIPLTLAIIDGMLLKVGAEHYIVSTLNVNQAFRPDPDAVCTVQGRGEMVMLRGTLIPLYRLHEIFGVDDAIRETTEGIIIVVEHEGHRCALLVDQLLGQQQVVIKSLGKGLGDVDGISGAAILGDGRVGLILDVSGVIQLARHG